SGIAGWVAESRQALVVEDVTADPRFAADQARRTGYVPKGLMAVPLVRVERVLGVLNVLDRPERRRFSVAEMDLLELFATQAAIALDLLLHARRIDGLLGGAGDDLEAVARLAATLDGLSGERRTAGARLLIEIENVLGR
ncbi:MAG: GAF domain-containing protein, partial [Solirubrobacteraceae bacterium]